MKNLKVGTKIKLGFVIVIVFMLISSVTVVVSNVFNTGRLNTIHVDSKLQTLGRELSDAFHESRLNSKIIIVQPNDESYAETVRYLALCDDIISQMKTYIGENSNLAEFYDSLVDVESKIKTYGREVDDLQNSNTTLSNTEGMIYTLGETLTALGDSLDGDYIAALYESASADITPSERSRQLDRLADVTAISQSIWTVRMNANQMTMGGIDYTNFDADLQWIDQTIALVEKSSSSSSKAADIQRQLVQYKELVEQFRDEMVQNNIVIENVVSGGTAALNALNGVMSSIDEVMLTQVEYSVNRATVILFVVIAIALVSIAAAVVMAMYITKSIVSILGLSVRDMENVTDAVVSSSQQLNQCSGQLAEGSNEQAASIEETSATMNQTAAMVRQTRENTHEAAGLSQQAEHHASGSVQKIENLIDTIANLSDSSVEIRNIVETIDMIALQTNILALNASVEAARAGDAGKGFAVVAEEVRSLSQKCAEAAKNTAEIVDKNIDLTRQGTVNTGEVSDALNGILTDAKKINTLLLDISAASDEQSRGIDQINIAMSQMEKATQSSAAIAQQSSASANEMLTSSQQLASVTSQLAAII